jgi:hypothetical protein
MDLLDEPGETVWPCRTIGPQFYRDLGWRAMAVDLQPA